MSDEIIWVCDGCLRTVTRAGIRDRVDGEHVLCLLCADELPDIFGEGPR